WPTNVMHWCVVNAPILAAATALLCAWDVITLKLALMPLPYFPGPDAVFQTLVDGWRSPGRGQPGLADCMWHSLMLLSSGYVAGTLGARASYLLFHVAIPAAMPNIFVGLFMGLGASFLTLIVAEAVGVQAGLGWYIDWARAYSDYTKAYAALIIMAAYFSTIM